MTLPFLSYFITILATNMDFQTATNLVLNYIRRPSAEVSAEVKEAINRAVQWAVTSHDFLVLESEKEVTYPLATAGVKLSTLLTDPLFKSLIDVQLLELPGDDYGDPLKIVSFQELQSWKQRLRDSANDLPDLVNSPFVTFVGSVDRVPSLQFFPVPATNLPLRVRYNQKLPELVLAADTNFILQEFPDYILYKACFSLFFYLKTDERAMFAKEAVQIEWERLTRWDEKLRYTTGPKL